MTAKPQFDADSALGAALQQHQAGRLAEARKIYGRILENDPRNPEALNLLGVLSAQQGDLARGRDLIQRAIEERPDNPQYPDNLAKVWHLIGEDVKAEQAYRRSVTNDPAYTPAWINLGNLMLKADRVAEAAESFGNALKANPRLVQGLEGLGSARQRQGRTTEAIAAFERAVKRAPDNASAHANLGGLLLDAGHFERAVTRLRRAQVLAPCHLDIHTNLGVALHMAGDPQGALGQYDASLRLSPGNARALGAKGLALAALGLGREAAAIFDHEKLLAVRQTRTVAGYPDCASFNAALAAQIDGDPTLVANRAGKSTRGGSQTGELLESSTGAMAALKAIIQSAVKGYFSEQETPGHPYRPLKPPRGRLTGWATVLSSGGYQEPHNHPRGVLSGVYYVQLGGIGESHDATGEQGCIEFGRPSAKFGVEAPINPRIVRPVEGLMLLFPSHFWHRTIPFQGQRRRISIAFDLVHQS